MRASLQALRDPLLLAADDGFAGIDRVPKLGEILCGACDRLLAHHLPAERVQPLVVWRRALARFERMSRDEQEIEIARGIRLCLAIAPSEPAMPTSPKHKKAKAAGLAPVLHDVLDAPVSSIRGVGPKMAACFAQKGIFTVEDLAWLVPHRYDDMRCALPLAQVCEAGEQEARVTLVAEIESVRYVRFRRRFLDVRLVDGKHKLVARWFHVMGGMATRFVQGKRVVLSGVMKQRVGNWEMANPDLLGDPDDHGKNGSAAKQTIRPRYPGIEGVAPAIVWRSCRAAIERTAKHIVDGVPKAVANRLKLAPLAEALQNLHAPPKDLSPEDVVRLDEGDCPWHRRLAFDELFVLSLAVMQRRVEQKSELAAPCAAPAGWQDEVAAALPFVLTSAQERANQQIVSDMSKPEPMNRLLQGDVGSGKTAVAFAATHVALASGRQVAWMAPTEILAEQHMRTIEPWLKTHGQRAALLTASTPRGVRQSMLSRLQAGDLAMLIGTHALLSERVLFADLGLVVIDEQHRFGVAQRVRLRRKGDDEGVPHLLVMTATPIPRTLALSVYGDLDVTTLDELPPGRTPPASKVATGARGHSQALNLVRREIKKGGRVFWVCPRIEPGEDADSYASEWADVVSTAERVAAELPEARVAMVHGRVPPVERDKKMRALASGELDVLVATTVVEVGVDVPQATVMIIDDADKFGLAQLHQLRGRVGRGGGKSFCLLLTRGQKTSDGARRLAVMAATTDGFRIAEEDLKIRGPGELLGVRQAGLPRLRFGDLQKHLALIAQARDEAERVLSEDPDLALDKHASARQVLLARTEAAKIYGSEGG